MVVRADIDQEETERSDLKKKGAVCRILGFWFIMKIWRPFLVSVLF